MSDYLKMETKKISKEEFVKKIIGVNLKKKSGEIIGANTIILFSPENQGMKIGKYKRGDYQK